MTTRFGAIRQQSVYTQELFTSVAVDVYNKFGAAEGLTLRQIQVGSQATCPKGLDHMRLPAVSGQGRW